MDKKMPKVADASPGGRKATSAKKRRLEALERQAMQASKRQSNQKPGKQHGGGKGKQPAEAPQQQAAAAQPGRPNTYDPLPEAVWRGPVGAGLKTSGSSSGMVLPPGSHFARHLPLHLAVRSGEMTEERAAADIGGQLDTNELLSFPRRVKGSRPPAPAARLLSGAQLRKKGLGLQRGELTREAVEKLAGLWRGFAAGLAGSSPLGASRLVRILEDQTDFHGCELTVEAAADPRHVGVTGVVVRNAAAAVTLAALAETHGARGAAGERTECDSGASVRGEAGPGGAAGGKQRPEGRLRVLVLPKAGSMVQLRFPTAAGEAVLRMAATALRVPGR